MDFNFDEFVKRLKCGDSTAWEQFIDIYSKRLIRRFKRILGDGDFALGTYGDFLDELYSDKIHRLNEPARLQSFVFQSATYFALNVRKDPRNKHMISLDHPDAVNLPSREPDPLDELLIRENRKSTLELYDSLNSGNASSFRRNKGDGLTAKEIADQDGIKLSAAEKRIQRGKAEAREILERDFPDLAEEDSK